MKLVYDEADLETQEAIRLVVLLLAAEMQPSREMDVLPAIDFGYAECRPYWEEGGYPGLVLTLKGRQAAERWHK